MHAFFYAMPLRRRPIVTAALVSAGAHAALLFSFTKDPEVPTVGTVLPEKPHVIDIIPANLIPPDAPAKVANNDLPDAEPRRSMTHARIPEPLTSFNPDAVTAPITFDPGQLPVPGEPTMGIPITETWGPSNGGNLKIWDSTELDKRPEPVVQAAPEYPFTAKNQGIEGVVIVRFIVTAAGAVESATIASSPNTLFSDAALNAVKRWTFRAGIKNGAKVTTRMEIPLTFRLSR